MRRWQPRRARAALLRVPYRGRQRRSGGPWGLSGRRGDQGGREGKHAVASGGMIPHLPADRCLTCCKVRRFQQARQREHRPVQESMVWAWLKLQFRLRRGTRNSNPIWKLKRWQRTKKTQPIAYHKNERRNRKSFLRSPCRKQRSIPRPIATKWWYSDTATIVGDGHLFGGFGRSLWAHRAECATRPNLRRCPTAARKQPRNAPDCTHPRSRHGMLKTALWIRA